MTPIDYLLVKIQHRLDQLTKPSFDRETVELLVEELLKARVTIQRMECDASNHNAQIHALLQNLADAEHEIEHLKKKLRPAITPSDPGKTNYTGRLLTNKKGWIG